MDRGVQRQRQDFLEFPDRRSADGTRATRQPGSAGGRPDRIRYAEWQNLEFRIGQRAATSQIPQRLVALKGSGRKSEEDKALPSELSQSYFALRLARRELSLPVAS